MTLFGVNIYLALKDIFSGLFIYWKTDAKMYA